MIGEFKGQYDWASNFYFQAPFYVQSQLFKSSEHYFAASKTLDLEWCKRILDAPTAAKAKKRGQKCPVRPNWNIVRIPVMADALWYKFSQNVVIQQKLIDTGTQEMVEGNWWHDNFWGDCHCNNKSGRHPECLKPGLNKLGLLTMNLRRYFQDVHMISL